MDCKHSCHAFRRARQRDRRFRRQQQARCRVRLQVLLDHNIRTRKRLSLNPRRRPFIASDSRESRLTVAERRYDFRRALLEYEQELEEELVEMREVLSDLEQDDDWLDWCPERDGYYDDYDYDYAG